MVSFNILSLLSLHAITISARSFGSSCSDDYNYEDISGKYSIHFSNFDKYVNYNTVEASQELWKLYKHIKSWTSNPKSQLFHNRHRHIIHEHQAFDNKKIVIASYLRDALSLAPASIFTPYNEAFSRQQFSKCYFILTEFFCPELKYERRVIETINRRNSLLHHHCPTHIALFDLKSSVSEVYAFARNCEEKYTTGNKHYLYLPKEIIVLDEWLCFSLNFDAFLIEFLSNLYGNKYIFGLKNMFIKQQEILNKNILVMDPYRREAYILKLKLFSFYIVSICLPFYKCIDSEKEAKLAGCLIELFHNDRLDVSYILDVGLAILNKSG